MAKINGTDMIGDGFSLYHINVKWNRMMPLAVLARKGQRENIIYVHFKYLVSQIGIQPSLISLPCSLKRPVQCADQRKMSVTCRKCVMVNLVFVLLIDSKSMASPARMGRATAWWGCAPRCRSSALSFGEQVGHTPVLLAFLPLSTHMQQNETCHCKWQCLIMAKVAFCHDLLS